MKYIKTLLQLKPISYTHIHNLINTLHKTNLFIEDSISYDNNHYVIKDNNIYAYHIEDQSIYEYIYNEEEHKLYICIDKRDNHIISIIDELIDKDYIDQSSMLYTRHHAFEIKNIDINDYDYDLPVIYLNNQLCDQEFVEALHCKVKGMAYVVYGSDDIQSSAIIFKHKEKLLFSPFHKETYSQLIERLFTKLQSYMCKYEYSENYSMNTLYQRALDHMIEKTKHHESLIEMSLEEKLLHLELDKEECLEKLFKLQNDIFLLESQIEDYQNILNQKDEIPLLYKGKEKEFYKDEQKEIMLYLIKKRLEKTHDKNTKTLLQSLIDDNPSSNLREEKLEEILRLFVSSKKITNRIIESLKPIGFILTRNIENHYFFNFYNDSRYLIDIASSPSDIYWSKQAYREIKRQCF